MPEVKTPLTEEERAEARTALKDAIYHLTSCWDALNSLEGILGVTVESSDIDSMAFGIGSPGDAYQLETAELDEQLDSLLEEESAELETE